MSFLVKKLRSLAPSFACITVQCRGRLEFANATATELHAAYICDECGLLLGVVNPPTRESERYRARAFERDENVEQWLRGYATTEQLMRWIKEARAKRRVS